MQHLHLHLRRHAHQAHAELRPTIQRRPPLPRSLRALAANRADRLLDSLLHSQTNVFHGAYSTPTTTPFQRFLEKIIFRFLAFWYHAHMRKVRTKLKPADTQAVRELREHVAVAERLTRSISIKPLAPDYERWRRVVGRMQEENPTLKMPGIFRIICDILEREQPAATRPE